MIDHAPPTADRIECMLTHIHPPSPHSSHTAGFDRPQTAPSKMLAASAARLARTCAARVRGRKEEMDTWMIVVFDHINPLVG